VIVLEVLIILGVLERGKGFSGLFCSSLRGMGIVVADSYQK
jgi:hypothetical protein